jgi:hypothetical protein
VNLQSSQDAVFNDLTNKILEKFYLFVNSFGFNLNKPEIKEKNKKEYSTKKKENKKAWLCAHVYKNHYARGKCRNCYLNHYNKVSCFLI